MKNTNRLLDYYLPPTEDFLLESFVATTYQADFEFIEEELLTAAFGVRSPTSQLRAFRSELERKLQTAEVSILYDLGGCEKISRLSPRIDAVPITASKLHSKISLLMWSRPDPAGSALADRRIRMIIGSANLTRQGFRQNYECVVSLDFGGKNTSPRFLLIAGIALVTQMAEETQSQQLSRQLLALTAQSALLPEGVARSDWPEALVSADDLVASLKKSWSKVSELPPRAVTLVSPFWPEGSTAAAAFAKFFDEVCGMPSSLELVCRGGRAGDGTWLPVFDNNLAIDLRNSLACRIYLRAALPDMGPAVDDTADEGDEMEEASFAARLGTAGNLLQGAQRALHAKIILIDGPSGSVLYVGSSNFTRRGLGIGALRNSEAGFLYRLTPQQRKQMNRLYAFAGPSIEILKDRAPATLQPISEDAIDTPTFLADVVANGTLVTIRFRNLVPPDLVILMPIPSKAADSFYWILYQANGQKDHVPGPVNCEIGSSKTCGENLEAQTPNIDSVFVQPHVYVEVRWGGGLSARFPVRFDDKTQLPLVLMGRRHTEGELIDYFLFGKEPFTVDGDDTTLGQGSQHSLTDRSIDTRSILAYFMRNYVKAIPALESEIRRASYCRPALEAALRGPTSPLELAVRISTSLTRMATSDEPDKTPVAVGFQLTELVAALLRCQSTTADQELRACFVPVVSRCRLLLQQLQSQHNVLQSDGFRKYQAHVLGADA